MPKTRREIAAQAARIKAKLAKKDERARTTREARQRELLASLQLEHAGFVGAVLPVDEQPKGALTELQRKDAIIARLRARIRTLTDENASLRDRLFSPAPKRPRGRPKNPAKPPAKPGRKVDVDAQLDAEEFAIRVCDRSDKEGKPRLQVIEEMLKEQVEKSGKNGRTEKKGISMRNIKREAKLKNALVSRHLLKISD